MQVLVADIPGIVSHCIYHGGVVVKVNVLYHPRKPCDVVDFFRAIAGCSGIEGGLRFN